MQNQKEPVASSVPEPTPQKEPVASSVPEPTPRFMVLNVGERGFARADAANKEGYVYIGFPIGLVVERARLSPVDLAGITCQGGKCNPPGPRPPVPPRRVGEVIFDLRIRLTEADLLVDFI